MMEGRGRSMLIKAQRNVPKEKRETVWAYHLSTWVTLIAAINSIGKQVGSQSISETKGSWVEWLCHADHGRLSLPPPILISGFLLQLNIKFKGRHNGNHSQSISFQIFTVGIYLIGSVPRKHLQSELVMPQVLLLYSTLISCSIQKCRYVFLSKEKINLTE